MSKVSEIVKGWKNYMFPNKDVEELATERMEICITCDKLSNRNYCGICGCYMPTKVRSVKSKCGDKKW